MARERRRWGITSSNGRRSDQPQSERPQSSEPLWRALAVFRFASLGYAALLVGVVDSARYSRPDWAWGVLAAMLAWTVATTVAYARPDRRTPLLLSADLAVTIGVLLSTVVLQYPSAVHAGVTPVTATWMAGPALAWAIRYGAGVGAVAALILAGCDFLMYHKAFPIVLNGLVLLVLASVVVGHLARLTAEVAAERQRAVQVEAAGRERERLARDMHDSVLQVLAMAQRRGAETGGAAAEFGKLAGELEATYRTLVNNRLNGALTGSVSATPGGVDLRSLLLPAQSEQVTVAVPATAVMLDGRAADELASAVRAALDNVGRHCGEQARAWVLVEDEPTLVTVTIRDDGPGISEGRLAEAAAAGRLGVSHSICGRLRDLGGSAAITSVPGEGTEVELRLPRRVKARMVASSAKG